MDVEVLGFQTDHRSARSAAHLTRGRLSGTLRVLTCRRELSGYYLSDCRFFPERELRGKLRNLT